MRDKLLCGTSGTTGLAHIPFVSLLDELLTVGIQPLSLCQRPDDLRIQLLIRRVKRNRQSEAVCQRLAPEYRPERKFLRPENFCQSTSP